MYKHRQTAHVINTVVIIISIFLIPLFALNGEIALIPLVIGMMVLAMLLFYSLTICVDDRKLTFYFGIGLIRKSVSLSSIESCSETTSQWYHGFGIHYTGNGWLYNVSGFTAVEIVEKSGKRFRLGTDEPKDLCRTINDARTKLNHNILNT
jgi:hypothetical protein